MVSTLERPTATILDPGALPPPLPNELLIPQDLRAQIRDGSMPLGEEDWLMEEVVDICLGAVNLGYIVEWTPPPDSDQAEDYFDRGFEVVFRIGDGKPCIIASTTRRDHIRTGDSFFDKRIPRPPFPKRPYLCPLSAQTSKAAEYRLMGYDPCGARGFANFADWNEHVRTSHGIFYDSLKATDTVEPVSKLWNEAVEDVDVLRERRLASDPRPPFEQRVAAANLTNLAPDHRDDLIAQLQAEIADRDRADEELKEKRRENLRKATEASRQSREAKKTNAATR